jgi:DNA processing protein
VTGPDPAYVALALVPGIGQRRLQALLSRFPGAAAVLAATQADLEDVPTVSKAGATAIRSASVAQAERLIARTTELGGVVLAPHDGGFPSVLRDIPDPPALLFAAGRLELGREPAVAMVGSRTHTRYGGDVCRYLAGGAARAGLAVVSGMARGIDALAHAAALDAGGGTVGILGNGLGVIYPSANRALYERVQARGLFLTEFPPGERPNAGSFQRRNRLISGLARVTVVIEAREKSGALITVDCALAQGREVLVVPAPSRAPRRWAATGSSSRAPSRCSASGTSWRSTAWTCPRRRPRMRQRTSPTSNAPRCRRSPPSPATPTRSPKRFG